MAGCALYLPGTDASRRWKRDRERFALGGAEVVTGPPGCQGEMMLRELRVRFFAEALQRALDKALDRGPAAAQ